MSQKSSYVGDDRDPPGQGTIGFTNLPIAESSAIPGANQFIVPGIELVSGTQPKPILKCFKMTECQTLGPQLVKVFQDNGVPIELSDVSGTYEHSGSIRPNHFEAWFTHGLPQ